MVENQIGEDFVHATKKCPECYTYVSLRTTKCPSCNTRLGEVEKHGMAKKTVDWNAYLLAFLAVLGFVIYIWWAFL